MAIRSLLSRRIATSRGQVHKKSANEAWNSPVALLKSGRISELTLSGFDDSALGATRFGVRGTFAVVRLFKGSTRFSHFKLLQITLGLSRFPYASATQTPRHDRSRSRLGDSIYRPFKSAQSLERITPSRLPYRNLRTTVRDEFIP